MAKDIPPSPETYLSTIEALKNDLKGISGFLSQEFVKLVTKYDGVIDVTNLDFQQAAQSLIHADPKAPENAGRPVLSFTGTEQGIKEKIKKLQDKGVPATAFTELLEQIETTKKNLSAQISTNEGIKGFVESRVKDKLIEDSIGLFASDGKGGVQMLPVADKKQLKESLLPAITLPEGLVQKMLKGDKTLATTASTIINEEVTKAFGKKVGKVYVLDKTKLTPENIASVSNKITNGIAAEAIKLDQIKAASPLINDVIKQMEKEHKVKFTPERVEKITKALAPTLAKLGPEYLEQNKADLTKELTKTLKSEQSYSTAFTGSYTVSTNSLNKIATKLEKQHQPQAKKASVKKVEGAKNMVTKNLAQQASVVAHSHGLPHPPPKKVTPTPPTTPPPTLPTVGANKLPKPPPGRAKPTPPPRPTKPPPTTRPRSGGFSR